MHELEKISRGKKLVEISTYCLMPNHFHLLMIELVDGGISKFMQKLTTAYTMFFNKSNNRTGSLFQGKFKARHVASDDNYLKYLVAYIHLNPVKLIDPQWKKNGIKNRAQAEEFLDQFNYSSYLDFLNKERVERIILNKDALPKYFGDRFESFKENISEWLDYGKHSL